MMTLDKNAKGGICVVITNTNMIVKMARDCGQRGRGNAGRPREDQKNSLIVIEREAAVA